MKDYSSLIGIWINSEYDGEVFNSWKILSMKPTNRHIVGLEGNGRIWDCPVKWKKSLPEAPPAEMGFDEQTLDELLVNKYAVCPYDDKLIFRIQECRSTIN